MTSRKMTLTVNSTIHQRLAKSAEERGISVPEFIRAVIIPQYYQSKRPKKKQKQ
jgi:predicted HicB family RNase H-like nuclease